VGLPGRPHKSQAWTFRHRSAAELPNFHVSPMRQSVKVKPPPYRSDPQPCSPQLHPAPVVMQAAVPADTTAAALVISVRLTPHHHDRRFAAWTAARYAAGPAAKYAVQEDRSFRVNFSWVAPKLH
jgi:hypothetical protein